MYEVVLKVEEVGRSSDPESSHPSRFGNILNLSLHIHSHCKSRHIRSVESSDHPSGTSMSRRLVSPSTRPSQFICTSCRHLMARRSFATSPRKHLQRDNDLLTHLERRGLLNQIAGDRNLLSKILQTRKIGFYAGIDPTAPSLHLGHLLPLMVLFWTYIYGHEAVSLVGGATARVGDPSGRLTSRESTGRDVQRRNFEAMLKQVKGLWGSVGLSAQRHGAQEKELGGFQVVDNAQWLEGLGVLEFLRTLGNGMRVGTMLGRET